jgi:hypothetical protein
MTCRLVRARRRLRKAVRVGGLLIRGVAPWKSLPAEVGEGGCDHCWRMPLATRKDAWTFGRSTHMPWDVKVWQCGQYWHQGSRREIRRQRAPWPEEREKKRCG